MLVPTHSPTVLLLCGSVPSNLSRLPGRAFLSACRQYPVLPVPAVCRVLSCRVVSVARLFSLVLFGCSFARLVPCTATNQTVAVTFPPLPLFRTLSLPPHKSRPIDFSPAATSQPSPSPAIGSPACSASSSASSASFTPRPAGFEATFFVAFSASFSSNQDTEKQGPTKVKVKVKSNHPKTLLKGRTSSEARNSGR